eukprot:3752183-Amphidinium_carterae.1
MEAERATSRHGLSTSSQESTKAKGPGRIVCVFAIEMSDCATVGTKRQKDQSYEVTKFHSLYFGRHVPCDWASN